MKKILFSSSAAILGVMSLTAFGNTQNVAHTYYWFAFEAAYIYGEPGLATPGYTNNNHHVGQLTYIGFLPNTHEALDVCSNGSDLCLAGYTFGQLNFTTGKTVITSIKTNAVTNLPDVPVTVGKSITGATPVIQL